MTRRNIWRRARMRRPRPGQVAGFAIAPSIRDYFRSLGTAALILQDIEIQKAQKSSTGYPFHSALRADCGFVRRSSWTARDAPVPLPEAEAGASAQGARPTRLRRRHLAE